MANILIAILQIIFAIALIVFWLYFILIELKKPSHSEIYLAYEKSFPVPDLCWITPSLIISAIGLLIDERIGIFFSAISGGALIFLGLLDLSFNIQQGVFKEKKSDALFNLTINTLTLIMGIISLVFAWVEFSNLSFIS